mmetsp:Transcript_17460/g.34068  ORF Transcript_17460/g.34068 Transcript_17460/m.34068 type:complete len:550 (+) Transcript_17460:61-1710(+)
MIEYSTGDPVWRLAFRCRGSIIPRAGLFALPAAILAVVLLFLDEQLAEAREYVGVSAPQATVLWAAVTAPLFTLISFRTSVAMRRFWEGTGLLHAMRGEWFDSASCLMTFTISAKQKHPERVSEFRHTLLRLMSLCHGSALDELKNNETEDYEVIDSQGLDSKTIAILRQCKQLNFNRVEVLLHMIQVLVIDAQQAGVISVPPPILTRVYQTLSRGFVNLLNAKKIKDTRFPFPYAQLSAAMLVVLVFFTPVAMSAMIPEKTWCVLATFFPVFCLFCMYSAAEELEMPFGEDPNDLPLGLFQEEMNSSLLMLFHESSDHIPRTGKHATKDFMGLMMSLHDSRNSLGSFYVPTRSKSRSTKLPRERQCGQRKSIFVDVNLDDPHEQESEADGCANEEVESHWSEISCADSSCNSDLKFVDVETGTRASPLTSAEGLAKPGVRAVHVAAMVPPMPVAPSVVSTSTSATGFFVKEPEVRTVDVQAKVASVRLAVCTHCCQFIREGDQLSDMAAPCETHISGTGIGSSCMAVGTSIDTVEDGVLERIGGTAAV